MRVHAVDGIADGHRSGGVAVIGILKTDEPIATGDVLVSPKLRRDFHGNFDGDGPGIVEEDMVQVARRDCRQSRGQASSRFVRDPTQHDVGHRFQLIRNLITDVRMVVAMAGCPPRCQSINDPLTVFQDQINIIGSRDTSWVAVLHLGVGHPEIGFHIARVSIGVVSISPEMTFRNPFKDAESPLAGIGGIRENGGF